MERDGIAGLSARQIARDIGYSAGTIYNSFANLDDVLITLQVQLLGRIVDHLRAVPLGNDGEKNIDALTQAYVAFAIDNRRMWNLLFAHSIPAEAIPAAFHAHLKTIAGIVQTALAPFAPHAPREKLATTARALWAGVHGITAIAATEKGAYLTPETALSYARELALTFVNGLRSR